LHGRIAMFRKGNSLVSTLAALALVASAVAQAQTPAGRLTGVVRAPDGAPLPGTRVAATTSAGIIRGTTTDGEGRYAIGGLSAGSYSVTAAHVGFRRGGSTVTMNGDATADFSLDPLP